MLLSEEVLQTLQLVLCSGSYGGVSFHDVKKACFDKSADAVVVKLSITLCESRGYNLTINIYLLTH